MLLPAVHGQDACQVITQLHRAQAKNFAGLTGEQTAVEEGMQRYRSKVTLPGFDQNYFENDEHTPPAFTAKMIGFESLQSAGKTLDSLLQSWSSCLRGYTFYKEENCRLGCFYYVTTNDSREVAFYVSYLEDPGQPWYAITLRMTAGKPMLLPPGLTLLASTHPPLEVPAGKLDACETVQLYLKAGVNDFQDLLADDGTLKVPYPEALRSSVTDGKATIVLATQQGDEDTDLDEVYFLTQSMLNKCLSGWSQLELLREDDADFMNDRRWLKNNESVTLKYEISKGGKGKNSLVLEIAVR